MNRIYRHVWNKAQGRYIVAAETASSGRGSSRAAVSAGAVFSAMLTVLCFNSAYAQTIVAPGGNTVVYRAANGVQIINIEAANQAGLSHNRYTNYNVEQTGTVLNNGNNSQLSRNSQLAGQVLNNPNLSAEARVILNEVVAPNRSSLRGFTEVVGSRADVVLANPWGITCAGCGFINTDRAVLSTGTPQFGPSGNLTEFRTIGGDILIEGAGLDATSTRAIDLVARSIRVDGQINAADLGITVGASQWNYENRNSQVVDVDGKPLYALDSSRLGGMYANRIAIVATEYGVGVRMRGDIAASADDFSMDANGRVEIESRLSAARDLRLRQWGPQAADAFQVSGSEASLTAGKDMHIMAAGGLVLTDATIKAEGNMLITAQQLDDRAGSQANGARAATGELKLEVADTASLNNTSWSSQQNLDIKAASLVVGADGATLAAGANTAAANRVLAVVATTGDIDLSGANVAGAHDVRIAAEQGAVRVGTGGAQAVAAGQDLSVVAATELNNRGTIGATRDVSISASDAAKTLAVVNRGTIQSEGKTTITGTAGARNLTLDNQAGAGIATKGNLSVMGTQVSNAGVIQSGDALALNVSGELSNAASGQILGQGLGSVVNLDGASLDNAGVVQSRGALTVKTSGAVTQVTTGAIQTLGTDQAGSGWALVLDTGSLNNMGMVSGGGELTAQSASTIENTGTIQSKGATALSATTTLNQTNAGNILSEAAASVKAATIANAGAIQSKGVLSLTATKQFTQTGTTLSDAAATVTTDLLDNEGTIQSKGAMALSATTKLNQTNTGKILSDDGIVITTAALDNSGRIQAGKSLSVGTATVRTQLDNRKDGVMSADSLDAWVTNFVNAGTVQANAGALIDASNQITNTQGATLTTGLTGNSGGVLNAGGTVSNAGTINTAGQLSVYAEDMTNLGAVSVNNALSINAREKLVNTGSLRSDAQINLLATNANNTGDIVGAAALSMTVAEAIANSGTLHGGTNTLKSRTLSNQGDVKAVSTLDVVATDALGNTGKVLSDGSINVRTASLTNAASGKVVAGTTLTGNSVSGVMTLQNAGTLQSGTDMALGGATQRVALANQANGKIMSGGDFTVYGTDITNAAGARMQWMKDGLVDATSLSNQAVNSVIVGSLGDGGGDTFDSVYRLSGSAYNNGAIHSGGNLTLTAATYQNTATSGLSALNDLSVTATAASNGGMAALRNEGAFYAGRNMTLVADAGTVANFGESSTMDAEGDITVKARDIANYGAVRATNITMNASNSFINQLATELPEIVLDWDNEDPGAVRTIKTRNTNCGIWPADDVCDELHVREQTTLVNQKFSNTTMEEFKNRTKAQILATKDLKITFGAGGGKNIGALLSADKIAISGSGNFSNEDYHLDTVEFTRRWTGFKHNPVFSSAWWVWYTPDTAAKFADIPHSDDDHPVFGGAGDWAVVGNEAAARAGSYRREGDHTFLGATGAGVFANTLTIAVSGSVTNRGGTAAIKVDSAKSVTTKTTSETGTSSVIGLVGGVGAIGSISGVGAITGASSVGIKNPTAAAGLTLNGIVIKLPSNPNGYFVPSKNSGTKYLVETNPLFQVPSSFLGSDYLAEQLGFDPEVTQKRLGDSNYEAYLIRQQLIGQIGNNLLNQKESEAAQMQRMMDNAVTNAKGLGLTYGKAPTPEQLANLKEDMVWMVETEVDGQKVLAPVVYLSKATLDAVEIGTTMVASDTTIKADTVTNEGAKLGGSNTLAVTARGDITNTSGTITGGNVNLKSTEGSIVNQTAARTFADDYTGGTDIGKTAGIVATGTLGLDAAKDVKVIGANIDAKDATIAAGGNITVDTIVDTNTQSSASRSGGFLVGNTITNSTSSTSTNIGSNLNIGGNLTLKSGGDTTIAGSDVKVGGNLAADTGGDFNVLARQDTASSRTETSTSGLGVGGGLYGTSTTTTNNFKGTNSGSSLTVGGNANIKSEGTMTVQGSDVNVGGNAAVDAKKGIAILDGLDEERTSTRTETTTFMKVGGNSAAEATASAASKAGSGSKAAAEASAEASGSLKLAETTVTNTLNGSKTSVASTFNVGGSLDMKTDGTLTVQGSDVKAGGDLSIDAKTVNVLAGRNETYASADSKSDSIGFYGEASAKAGANAGAMGANASASASAEAESTLTVGARTESASFSEGSTTNRGSTLSGGGNVTIKAKDDATFVGATVTAGNDLSVQATNIKSMAAQDTTYSTESTGIKTAGLYLSAGAEASANANAGGASANASAEASAGLRYAQSDASSSSGSVTQQTSSFTAGGNVNRNATGTITDQGTQITAGGNINQTANEIREVAANNSSWESSNASNLDARIGVYAGAEAGADSRTGQTAKDASVGVKASVAGGTESESSSSSTAVTSRYQAGGNINSTSTNGTTLIGTQFESGGNVNINAGSLDYQAARDTTSSSSNSLSGSAEVKVGILGSAGVNGSVDVEGGTASSSSSTARAGGINAGGTINVNTGGNATFEGTNLNAGKGVNVGAGGDVTFNAATSTSQNSSISGSLSLSGGSSGSGAGKSSEGAVGASLEASKGASTTAVGSNISAGSGGVNISGGKNVNLEGTQVQTTGATTVSAGGTVNMTEAKSSEYQVGVGVTVGGGSSSEDGKSKGSGGFGVGIEAGGSSSSQGVNIQSGGGTRVINNAPASSVIAPAAPAAVAPAVVAPASTGASLQVAPTSSGGRQVAPSVSRNSASAQGGIVAAPSVAAPATNVAIVPAPAAGIQAAPSGGIAVAPAVISAPAPTGIQAAPSGGIAVAPAVISAPAPTGIQAAPSGGIAVAPAVISAPAPTGIQAAPSGGIAVAPAVVSAPAPTGIQAAPSGGIAVAPAVISAPAPTGIQAAPSGGIAVAPAVISAPAPTGIQAAPSGGIAVAPAVVSAPAPTGIQVAPSGGIAVPPAVIPSAPR
ncbi:filamentous hemagglutinin N-terminal domain-containing protein [Pigmentiphaga aceris]|uniref:Filamentous hemagglutinin N-terminal domain-containing protein n=1 Tax=Pigmentiphaga aceris TaxID=1940612 RepID=A0A5C0AWW6_9BURK|nr:hemagglutinin repeat-containing protein [Pigmentiphaga aceris]QEI05320.1 filamentous hemagglutinin N-terminal domain-containing protein [Pigmentiphaga aceris]